MSLDLNELLDDLILEEAANLAISVEEVTVDEKVKKRLSSKALAKAGLDNKKVHAMPQK